MDVQINWFAVLLAAVASMGIGFLWYSPMLFAKPWMKLMGLTAEKIKENQKEMQKMYMLSFVAALVTSFVLFHVMTMSRNFYNYAAVPTGLTSAFWMWLGFVMPVQLTDVIFGGKQWKLFYINTGYQLVSLLAMGIVIGLFM